MASDLKVGERVWVRHEEDFGTVTETGVAAGLSAGVTVRLDSNGWEMRVSIYQCVRMPQAVA